MITENFFSIGRGDEDDIEIKIRAGKVIDSAIYKVTFRNVSLTNKILNERSIWLMLTLYYLLF